MGLFLVLGAISLSAQAFDFTLVNKTGYAIQQVFCSPTGADDWGDDVLGEDILKNKESVEITFDALYEILLLAFDVDKYDIMVVYEDDSTDEWANIKLEEISELTLALDRRGNGVATFK